MKGTSQPLTRFFLFKEFSEAKGTTKIAAICNVISMSWAKSRWLGSLKSLSPPVMGTLETIVAEPQNAEPRMSTRKTLRATDKNWRVEGGSNDCQW